jgi:uncharacterized protein (TIGR03435 family)
MVDFGNKPLLAVAVLLGLLSPLPGRGQPQTAATPPLTFEVATIKPSDPNNPEARLRRTNLRFAATNYTIKRLIAFAYDVEMLQVSSGPGWASSDGFDVTAKTPDDVAHHKGLDDDKIMVQALLLDRFKLTIHRETKELPIYALVIGKKGSRLQAAKPHVGSDGLSGRGGTHFIFTDAPLSLLVHILSQRLERPVVDRTGLDGHYDFKLDWSPDQKSSDSRDSTSISDSSGPTLFTAIQEQLGLQLESQKASVEILVIDHVERPSEN